MQAALASRLQKVYSRASGLSSPRSLASKDHHLIKMAEDAAAAAPTNEIEAAPAPAAPAPVVEEALTPDEALKRVIRSVRSSLPACFCCCLLQYVSHSNVGTRPSLQALVVDGLRRGLHECAKSLAKATKAADGSVPVGGARLVLLATDCDEPAYVKLVKALAAEKNVPIREVAEAKVLGELVGLCKLDAEGKARKVVSTSVATITDFGVGSKALEVLLADLKA